MSNWPAAAAPTDKPSDDWTLIPNSDGKQRWAYKGHPLHHYAADKQAGDAKGTASRTQPVRKLRHHCTGHKAQRRPQGRRCVKPRSSGEARAVP
ncbi:hypothetical protein [Paraburkholderia sp. JPY419]|uniref:hypothetical protein n=1 Tax=Paraburkholderia sp. JPY419 TaxID=667660 RepID=UPI003D25334B